MEGLVPIDVIQNRHFALFWLLHRGIELSYQSWSSSERGKTCCFLYERKPVSFFLARHVSPFPFRSSPDPPSDSGSDYMRQKSVPFYSSRILWNIDFWSKTESESFATHPENSDMKSEIQFSAFSSSPGAMLHQAPLSISFLWWPLYVRTWNVIIRIDLVSNKVCFSHSTLPTLNRDDKSAQHTRARVSPPENAEFSAFWPTANRSSDSTPIPKKK